MDKIPNKVKRRDSHIMESPESKLWRETLIACINRTIVFEHCVTYADKAVQEYQDRFSSDWAE